MVSPDKKSAMENQERGQDFQGPSQRRPAAAKSRQSCPILCDPIDGRPPGSAIPGILQARTLEWVAISFSNAWKWKVKVKSLSRVRPLVWTAAYQAPPSMGFSRQEYWSGVPLPSPQRRPRDYLKHYKSLHLQSVLILISSYCVCFHCSHWNNCLYILCD